VNKKNRETLKKRINKEEDFIYCPRLENSLNNLISKNPDGIDDERMCKVLLITEKELKKTFDSAIMKIRKKLNIKTED